MPIIRITKQVIEDAKKARDADLKNDPEFRALEEEKEKEELKAIERLEEEVE